MVAVIPDYDSLKDYSLQQINMGTTADQAILAERRCNRGEREEVGVGGGGATRGQP